MTSFSRTSSAYAGPIALPSSSSLPILSSYLLPIIPPSISCSSDVYYLKCSMIYFIVRDFPHPLLPHPQGLDLHCMVRPLCEFMCSNEVEMNE